MKKYSIAILSIVSGVFYSQVTIGKTVPSTAPSSTSVSIELGNATGGNKGIVLPWVTQTGVVAGAVPGTIVFDSRTTEQKIYFAKAATPNSTAVSQWVDLSVGALRPTTAFTPDTNDENNTAKVLIGGDPVTDTTPGVLVLGGTDKAMVLPRVASIADIVSPSAGMVVFVTGTTTVPINQLAVFNGKEWSFWGAEIPVVTSPITNRIWMDRNLGAARVATVSTDALAYGDLYQWGRLTDGHQSRTSGLTATLSTTDVPGSSNFITGTTDWRSTQNNNLWQGVNGVNNPCPQGFRLPTLAEFQAEGFASAAAAFTSPLKLTVGGSRNTAGSAAVAGTGNYYTSTISGSLSAIYTISAGAVSTSNVQRATGASVRCIRN